MKKLVALFCALAMLCVSFCALAESQVVSFESRGNEIPATVVTPDGASEYPFVVLSHGHGGNREELGVVADALAAQGVASIRVDFPGCGDSTESFQANTLSNMEADVTAAIDYMKATYPVTKTGLFGYSMGGRITLELLAKGAEVDAIVLLAPAADTTNLKDLFGGQEAYEAMRVEADANGYVVFTTIYGQVQELSKEWFADLDLVADSAAEAAAVWNGPSLVIWGDDDEAVAPSISANTASVLGSETINATGEGHGYGFYSDNPELLGTVTGGTADFFAANLK